MPRLHRAIRIAPPCGSRLDYSTLLGISIASVGRPRDAQRREEFGVGGNSRNPAFRWSSRFSVRREDTLKRELQPTKSVRAGNHHNTAFPAAGPLEVTAGPRLLTRFEKSSSNE